MIYELAYIYIIYDIEDQNLIYYGSTCDLKARMCRHKCLKINKCTSRQIIERGNYKYAILETHENIDEYDLVERERWYILNKPCVNKKIPHRTRAEYYQDNKEKLAEYYQDNKEKIAEQQKEYRQDNKEKIAERKKEYYQDNKEKLAEYYQDNKEKIAEQQKEYYQDNKEKIAERTKEYRQNNKEKIAEQQKEYYQDNKEKIAERNKEKFVCECGGKFTYHHTAQHKKSKKHLKWVQSCKI
jgi:hypothetical protein